MPLPQGGGSPSGATREGVGVGVGRPLADGAPKHEQPDDMTALPVLWGDEGPAVHPLEASPPAFAQVGKRAR